MVNILQSLFDASIPGQRINAAREQRAQRAALDEQRQRDSQAFKAIQSGDVLGAAANNPEIAAQYQGVKQSQDQFKQDQSGADQQRFQQAGLRAARAGKSMVASGVDPLEAFDRIANQSGGLFGSPEEMAELRGFVEQGGAGAFDAIERALGDPNTNSNKGRYISTRGGVFDTQTQKIIANADPLADLQRQKLQSEIGATDALAEQRRAKAEAPAEVATTVGEKEIDKKFAKDALEFMQGGGSTAASNIARLDNALTTLANENVSGPLAGLGSVEVRSIINPKSAAVQQQVQNAIQESLKATLGAQFARVEGEQLLARAFDPRQSEEENIRRVKIVAETLREMLDNKQQMVDYFMTKGTLKGYQGPQPDPQKFIDVLDQFNTVQPKQDKGDGDEVDSILKKYGVE